MRAVVIHEFGGPECLFNDTVPDPVPGYGDVVVRVAACGVNNADLQIRRGVRAQLPLPHICGGEVAGTVVAVAPDVGAVRLGTEVAVVPFIGCGYASGAPPDAPRFARRATHSA